MKNQNEHASVHGIIFDLDGTLIKSVVDFPKMKNKMIEYIQSLDIPDTTYTTQQTTNIIIADLNRRMIEQGFTDSDQEKIFHKISDILTEVEFENVDKVILLPGVREFIKECWDSKIKMGILTRASEKYTNACLELTGLNQYLNVIVSRDQFNILKAKPNLHSLNYIISELSVPQENILFVGDHKIDLDCAREGKIRFVGVLAGAYNRNMLSELGHDLLVEDFFELSKLVKEINNCSG